MQKEFDIKSFVFHGICIGAAAGMLALAAEDAPDRVDGIVTEGMFPNFSESIRNHMLERKKPTILTLWLVDRWMRHYTGHSMRRGPINVIQRVRVPLLMLHSKEDLYSTPKYAQKLYDRSDATKKRLVWFAHGKHSMLRITDTSLYDTSIAQFLAELTADQNHTEKEKHHVL